MEDLCGRRQWGGVIDKRYSMTDQEEVWYVMAAESAHCICVSPIPAGRQKNFGNEDIKPAAYKERKMDQKRLLMSMMHADEPVMNVMNVKMIH